MKTLKKLAKAQPMAPLKSSPIKAIRASNYKRQLDNSKWQANPLLKTNVQMKVAPLKVKKIVPAMKVAPLKVKKIVPAMKQYGDKGYKPSNGKGVGF